MPKQTAKKPVHLHTFLKFTALFFLLSIGIYTSFYLQGKSFIWEGDGFHQHYPFFREYLNILRHFLKTGDWQSWDWSIGLGANTLLTYGYYVIGDPFVYLGLLFPKGSEEFAFHILMFVRIWAVGVSFLVYAKKMRFSERSALISSIMYTFSHYVIYNVVRHPFFIHPMIFFPLLCLGVEKIFKKESGLLFILMIAISAASNFYFFYMLTAMIFLYALVRYHSAIEEKNWRVFSKWFLYFSSLYLIGLLLSAILFLPIVYGFLSASRAPSASPISLLFYPLHYYGLIFLNALTPGTIYWTTGGFSVLGILSLPFLIRKRKEQSTLFWLLIILSIMLLFPFFGALMNGMAGPYNRFTFVFPFYIALATAYFIDQFHKITSKDLFWMRWSLIAFTLLYIGASVISENFLLYLSPIFIGWIIYGLIFFHTKGYFSARFFQRIILSLVAINMGLNALNFYLPHGKNAMVETEDYGTIDEAYANVFNGIEKKLPENDFYRIGTTSNEYDVRNQYVYIDTPGISSYASLINGSVAEFAEFIESAQYQVIQPLRKGVDDRRIANQTLDVKYILTPEKYRDYIPADYKINQELSDESTEMLVAETENNTPFAYVETDGILRTEAEKLHPVQRESLLEEAVILETENDFVQPFNKKPTIRTQDGSWEFSEGIQAENPADLNEALKIKVTEKEGQLILHLDKPEDLLHEEVFIFFEGIDYQATDKDFGQPTPTDYRFRVAYNGQTKSIKQSDEYNFSSYFKRENILLHLNEVKTTEDTLTVEFDDPGYYSFENISLVSRPFTEEETTKLADQKNKNALDIEEFTDEYIKGSINTEKGMLTTNIPFSKGWQAYIDGKKVDTEKVNIGFMGVPITEGEHTVEFVYETPFLKTGLTLTSMGVALTIAYHLIYKRNKH